MIYSSKPERWLNDTTISSYINLRKPVYCPECDNKIQVAFRRSYSDNFISQMNFSGGLLIPLDTLGLFRDFPIHYMNSMKIDISKLKDKEQAEVSFFEWTCRHLRNKQMMEEGRPLDANWKSGCLIFSKNFSYYLDKLLLTLGISIVELLLIWYSEL